MALPRTIFTGFAPNLTWSDVKGSAGFVFCPWRWRRLRHGPAIKTVEERLQRYFGVPYALTFDSGRSALLIALQALGVNAGVEVAVQAYTCVVVSNAIRFAGGVPKYIDIDADFNLNPADLKRKVTPKTKVLIIQHTFGTPADLPALMTIAKEHQLFVIEDCAHAFGARYQKKLVGTIGDIGMFSFGVDKVLSSVRGGALITKNLHLAQRINLVAKNIPEQPLRRVIQHLCHGLFFWIGRKWYHYGVGKWLLALGKQLHLFSRIISHREKKGGQLPYYPAKFPNALATLLLAQLQAVDAVNINRNRRADRYRREITNPLFIHPPFPRASTDPVYFRYTLRTAQPRKVLLAAKQTGILLGDWYTTVIAPSDSSLTAARYQMGICPHAEEMATESFNLPTDEHLTPAEQDRLIHWLNAYGGASY